MALRTFRDAAGWPWQVWDTTPSHSRGRAGVAPAFAAGWLTFERLTDDEDEAPVERRRLVPIPRGWEEWPEPRLLGLLANATPVRPARTRPPAGRSE
jgi:hypothetical protein